MSGLENLRVLVLRPEQQASELARRLEKAGASPVVVPAIKILPPAGWGEIDEAVANLQSFDWIVFTSVNGVDSFLSRVDDIARLPGRVGAIGPGTRDRLEEADIVVEWMPGSFTSVALGGELPEPPGKVLLVRADIATTELDEVLRARGFEVTRVDAYRTESANAAEIAAALPEVDAAALTSASIARSFAEAVKGSPDLPAVCSIGPATSAACREAGLEVAVEAAEHSIPGLVEAITGLFIAR